MQIGRVKLANNLFMAPMAGVTDCIFRSMVARHGAGLTFSEMVSAKSLVYGNKNTHRLLENDGVRPWAVQFFGHEPQIMHDAIAGLGADHPFDIVNINMGCPMPKIVNNGDGAALMKNPVLVGQMVEAAIRASSRPVTVKIRLGFTPATKNYIDVARAAQESGAALVIVHGRTRDQYYTGDANWDEISSVKAALKIPVIGNGDIFVPEDALHRLKTSGCNGIMIARGGMGNPWLFSRTLAALETGELPPPPSDEAIIETALAHLNEVAARRGRIEEMRKHLSWYTKGMKGSADARRQINGATDVGQMAGILRGMLSGG
ncbi:MAG: tRNA dihydrouridine synthase DusB [Defluviitaleaceae bacterium]|nr:tRNA dihydrouridine synthase DusB [Defluviitaleaceae bacterium]